MGFITTGTRMWLTRSLEPFTFTNEYDNQLNYQDCDELGLYVHIPFCLKICHFCPYCKQVYNKQVCSDYIDDLLKEIKLVTKGQEKKKVTSLYFGGGSPALAIDRLKEITDELEEHFIITEGIGLELHPSDITRENLKILEDIGITKLSIGIQSFSDKYLETLGRGELDIQSIKSVLNDFHFETVSMDFIFALPNQTFEDLKYDIDTAFHIGANHIAIYPFIDFSFTNSQLRSMSKKEKRQLLDQITLYTREQGYERDSIWTFSQSGNEKYSSMTRDNFLGFGVSATTLLKDQFKINTFHVDAYNKRIEDETLPTSLTLKFSKRQRMIYYLFWTAYSTKVNEDDFKQFFGVELKRTYGIELLLARLLGYVTYKDHVYTMTLKGAFYYHYYENYYTLSYIDQMWGIMRKDAFPNHLEL